MHNFRI